MSAEEEVEVVTRIHPLRQAAVYIFSPLIIMDTFLLIFTTTFLASRLAGGEATGAVWAGLIGAVYPGVNLVFELFWGWLADKYGRRRPLIVGSIFTVPALVAFAVATEPWHLVLAAAFRGVGGAAGAPISQAIAADVAPRKVLGERMGAWTMSRYAAPLIGFAIAGPLWDINWRAPFLTAAVCEAFCVFLALFALPETIVRKKVQRKTKEVKEETKRSRIEGFRHGAGEYFRILKRRGVAINSFSIMMLFLSSTAASTIAYPLFAGKLGLSGTQISISYTVGLAIAVMGLAPGGALSDRIGRKWPILFAGFWGALTWPLFTLVPGMAIPFLGFVILELLRNAGTCIGGPAMVAYLFEWVPPNERGRASALTEFCRDAGTVIGLPLVGVIYAVFSPESAFYFAGIVGVITYIIIWIFWKNAPPPEELGK